MHDAVLRKDKNSHLVKHRPFHLMFLVEVCDRELALHTVWLSNNLGSTAADDSSTVRGFVLRRFHILREPSTMTTVILTDSTLTLPYTANIPISSILVCPSALQNQPEGTIIFTGTATEVDAVDQPTGTSYGRYAVNRQTQIKVISLFVTLVLVNLAN